MPTVEVHPDELRRLTGRDTDEDELIRDLFGLGIELEGRTEEGLMELEFAPDRLDRLSVEGIARSLRYQYGTDRGVYVPEVGNSDWTITVDPSVPTERPWVSGFVARGLDFTEETLGSLIQLQEKLHRTIGRQRKKGAIGVHDLTMLKGVGSEDDHPSITYRGIPGDEEAFVALESDEALTPEEVVASHPIGQQYGHLVEDYEAFPAIYDELGLFSLPPIVNGRRTEVDTGTTDLLIELTGMDQWTIDRMGTIIAYALDARGASIEAVEVAYEDETLERPDMTVRTKRVDHDRIERVLGIELTADEVVDLAERAGLDAEVDDGQYTLSIPPYRVDVLHPLDLIDDLGRSYGFNELDPRYPDVGTIGKRTEQTRLEQALRDGLVGLGFEDLLNFHLIGQRANFDRLDIEPGSDHFGGGRPARIAEPYSREYELLRTWALPSLLMVLENNTHRRYPQYLAEIGLVAHLDSDEPTDVAEHRDIAAVLADPEAGYEDAKTRLQFLADEHGVELQTPSSEHPSFLEGRVAAIELDGQRCGIIGEVHPRVLEEYDLEVPVAAFECRMDGFTTQD